MARLPHLLASLAAAAALAVAGCGGSDEPEGAKLPSSVTQTLLKQLDSVGDRVAANVAGACDDIYASEGDGGNIEPIDDALDSIPSDVDPEIRTALEQSIERLKQLVDEECADIRAAEQDEQTTPTETETVPTETETTPTETETTETETTPTRTETTPTETDQGGGNGQRQQQDGGSGGTGTPGPERGGAEAPGDGGGN